MIEKIAFGRTGHHSTRVIFGGFALSNADEYQADRTLEILLSYGINHIDTARDYGKSEELIGRWMRRHRADFFLATKTSARTYRGAREDILRSLTLLKVENVDLLQLHNLVDPKEWEQALAPGGALEALVEAKEQGLTRFLGITGHGLMAPHMHRQSIGRFPFDSVLVPYNWVLMQIPSYAKDFLALYEECRRKNIAIQTIKALARRLWPGPPAGNTWYEPLQDQEDITRAVHWVLAKPGLFLNSVGDLDLLPKVLQAAATFDPEKPPREEEMMEMVRRLGMEPIFSPS
ncbi:MAG: aldo/keto reductase [Candidatus Bipolaricaulota bacterium]|nr:aldo/keto reductase [Candidatus Bipolaricaulota bacterium]MDW8126166.1 aldo/keto reductase [Candidatus Bipolaricaulota bacterium]